MPQVACPEGEFRRVQQALAFEQYFSTDRLSRVLALLNPPLFYLFLVSLFFALSQTLRWRGLSKSIKRTHD